jgi:hypothetical protein
MDDIFNSPINMANYSMGMFIQDDYAELGLGAESSRNRFIICDKMIFGKLNSQARFNYLNTLKAIHINPYTGTMIEN